MTGSTFNFTKGALLALPASPDGKRTTVRDTKVSGLELRVTANGVKTFSWYRRAKNGDPQRVTIGRFPEISVDQARDEAVRHNAALVDGANPAAILRARREELTFQELFEMYIIRHAKVHKKTWREDEQRYAQYLARPMGSIKVSRISRESIAKCHSSITTAGNPVVANRVLALISSVFGRALEWSLVDSNPATGIRRNREVSRDRFLQSHELPRFFRAVAEESNDTIRDYIYTSLLTGARRANVLSMRWMDLNMTDKVWRIPDTKSGTPHTVALTGPMLELLTVRRESAPRSDVYVFPGVGKSGHLVEPKKAWGRLFDRDELRQIRDRIAEAGGSFEPAVDSASGTVESLETQLQRAKATALELDVECDGLRMEGLRLHDLRRTMGSWQAESPRNSWRPVGLSQTGMAACSAICR